MNFYSHLRDGSDIGADTFDYILKFLLNNLQDLSSKAKELDDDDGILVLAEMFATQANLFLDCIEYLEIDYSHKFFAFRNQFEWILINLLLNPDIIIESYSNPQKNDLQYLNYFQSISSFIHNWYKPSTYIRQSFNYTSIQNNLPLWKKYFPQKAVFSLSKKYQLLEDKSQNFNQNYLKNLAENLELWLLNQNHFDDFEFSSLLGHFLPLKRNLDKEINFPKLRVIDTLSNSEIQLNHRQFLDETYKIFTEKLNLNWWLSTLDDNGFSKLEHILGFQDLINSFFQDLKKYGKFLFQDKNIPIKDKDYISSLQKILKLAKAKARDKVKFQELLKFSDEENPLSLITLHLTGTFSKKRLEIEKDLLTLGFTISSNLQAKTKVVLYGNKPTMHKLQEAVEKDLIILNFAEFWEVLIGFLVNLK